MDDLTSLKIKEIRTILNLDEYDEFRDIDDYLILIAFTAKSYKFSEDIINIVKENFNNQQNYEYLEYIGDRILKAINIYLIDEFIINLLNTTLRVG